MHQTIDSVFHSRIIAGIYFYIKLLDKLEKWRISVITLTSNYWLGEPAMVARSFELPSVRTSGSATASQYVRDVARPAPRLALRAELLVERAAGLAGVRVGERTHLLIDGVPLHLEADRCQRNKDLFLRNRVFAVIGDDGSLCLRLPTAVRNDLLENGLCVPFGKSLLTWPVASAHQLEVAWRILLHTYWEVTDLPERHARRLWSEWVINH
jgi:hypothetical protein